MANDSFGKVLLRSFRHGCKSAIIAHSTASMRGSIFFRRLPGTPCIATQEALCPSSLNAPVYQFASIGAVRQMSFPSFISISCRFSISSADQFSKASSLSFIREIDEFFPTALSPAMLRVR